MTAKQASEPKVTPTCGVVMPISAIDGCDAGHWLDVKEIIFASIRSADMHPNLVSDDIEAGVIHKRIVQNIYDNEVVICDISAKNPNVMLELGMRLAFDKPVIVVKDDKTAYSFDASPIEHLTYPRDLHYHSVISFQSSLAEKILAMKERGNPNSFLKSFGTFKTAKLDHEEGTPLDVLMEDIAYIKAALRVRVPDRLPFSSYSNQPSARIVSRKDKSGVELCLRGSSNYRDQLSGVIKAIRGVSDLDRKSNSTNHEHFIITLDEKQSLSARREIANLVASVRENFADE